jgi:hypothetical protein
VRGEFGEVDEKRKRGGEPSRGKERVLLGAEAGMRVVSQDEDGGRAESWRLTGTLEVSQQGCARSQIFRMYLIPAELIDYY